MPRMLVIGGASLDVLHLKDRTVRCPGGAGLYTALAARRSGVAVDMFSPRPEPCPDELAPAAARLAAWLGPAIPPARLPRFEISYRQGRTEYLGVSLEAEQALSPDQLPGDLTAYDLVHVVSLKDAGLQLDFVQACRQRGARRLSAGTWPEEARAHPQRVRAVLEQVDYFFMNALEAGAVFGSPESARTQAGGVLFVTRGAQGVSIVQGETVTHLPGLPANEFDPTGAGDSFCGAALAFLIQGAHPILAARRAAALAAESIGQVGPQALLSDAPAPEIPLDGRVRIEAPRVERVAARIAALPEVAAFPFVAATLPPVGHPRALEFFFAATLQQFGFWTAHQGRYDRPLLARLGGTGRKGSDYLYDAMRRQIERQPDFCTPEQQAQLDLGQLRLAFRSDDGQDPMPALELHLEQARRYGRDMLALGLTPTGVLQAARQAPRPLQTFLSLLDRVGGYREDPLRKKSSLLALTLNQRPEGFLPLEEAEAVAPVIDYHAMRVFLRLGLVEVLDPALQERLIARVELTTEEEWAVRYAVYRAMGQLVACSGRSTGAVDQFVFANARRHCLEMETPDCAGCPADLLCAHRTGYFQPVLRTSFY